MDPVITLIQILVVLLMRVLKAMHVRTASNLQSFVLMDTTQMQVQQRVLYVKLVFTALVQWVV